MQDAADAKIICYHNLLQHATQIELLYGMLHLSTYDDAVCVNMLDTTSPYVKVWCPVLNLLKSLETGL